MTRTVNSKTWKVIVWEVDGGFREERRFSFSDEAYRWAKCQYRVTVEIISPTGGKEIRHQ